MRNLRVVESCDWPDKCIERIDVVIEWTFPWENIISQFIQEANRRLGDLCQIRITFHRHRRFYNPSYICGDEFISLIAEWMCTGEVSEAHCYKHCGSHKLSRVTPHNQPFSGRTNEAREHLAFAIYNNVDFSAKLLYKERPYVTHPIVHKSVEDLYANAVISTANRSQHFSIFIHQSVNRYLMQALYFF